jgi:competence protein ComEC
VGAALPGAVLRSAPSGPGAFAAAITAGALIVACQSRDPRRALHVALGAALAAVLWPVVMPGPGALQIHVIDVGQGDAIALRSPRGRWLLVDAGAGWQTGDAARFSILPILRRHGGDVVHLVLTHPHLDHIGGARTILESTHVDTLWDSGYVEPSSEYVAVLRAAQTRKTVWRRASAGDSIAFDGVAVRVLGPDSTWLKTRSNANDASVVLQVRYGEVTVLLTGDAEAEEEEWLVARYGVHLKSTVLKLGHHGSATSTTGAFLQRVSPVAGVVSVGTGNRYRHPSPSVLQALDDAGVDVLRTDDLGTIMLNTDGQQLDLVADGRKWRYSPPRSR